MNESLILAAISTQGLNTPLFITILTLFFIFSTVVLIVMNKNKLIIKISIVFLFSYLIFGYLAIIHQASPFEETVSENIRDEYNQVSVSILSEEGSYFWASNTNATTLGEAIDRENEYKDFILLEDTPDGRVIKSIEGIENEGDFEWTLLSKDCGENDRCEKNVDSIDLDKELEFVIVYTDDESLLLE